MARSRLLKCPDCNRRVSARAVSCPACGCPVRAQTIERTSKKWKGYSLLFGLLGALGAMTLRAGGELVTLGAALLALGAVGGALASFGAWWDHG